MTVKEVIDGFREGAEENAERDAYANELFQEAVRIYGTVFRSGFVY